MDDLTLAVKLAMDNSSFQQGIQNLKREMEVVQSQFRESTAGMKDWGKNLDGLKNYADALTQKIDIQKKVVQAYQEQLNKSKQGLEENAKKMLELKDKVGQAEQAWKNSEKTLGKNAEETQKLKAEYEKLKKEYDQQEQKVRNNQKAVEGYTIQLNNAKAKLNEMESELKQATAEIDKQGNAWLKLSEKAKEVGEKLKSVGDKMSSVGKDLSKKLTAPIVGAGVAAVKFASDLNESLNKVDVAFKNNANEVKTWSDTTLKSYGIAKGTALDMAASFGDMATSMGLNTKQAAEMSMKLVGLAGDLASFKNISIDVANTALTSVFTGETESLKQLGVVMTEANLQEYALSKGINKRIQDMSEAEKVQLRYNFVLEKTKNAQGDFERTGAGAANQMRIFQESLKELAETFGQQILPVITPMIAKLNEMIQKFAGLDDHTKKIIVVFAGVVAAIGPLLIFIGKLITAVGTITTAFGTLSGAMAAAGGASGAVGTAISALTGPVGIAIAAITGLIAIFVSLYKHNEDFRNKCNEVWNQVKQLISTVTEQIKTILQAFVQLVSAIWNKWGDDIMKIVNATFNVVKTVITTVLSVISGVIKTVTALIKGDWQGVWNGIKDITNSIWSGIKNIVTSVLNSLTTSISAALNVIKDIFSGIWNGIKTLTSSVWEGMKNTVSNAINSVKNTVLSVGNGIKNGLSGIWESVKSTAINAWSSLKGAASNIFNSIKEAILAPFRNIHIPLPHISVNWKSIGVGDLKIKIPDFDVNWYATGGIFNKPSIIGVGEAGPEAVIPISRLEDILAKALEKSKNSTINQKINIYSPTPLSPSEVARQTKNALRQLALEW